MGASTFRQRLQATAGRGLTRFVGRQPELTALQQTLAHAGMGHGQVVAIVGEAGVGKSRLVYEFVHAHDTQGWRVLESTSVSYGRATPYFPIIDLLWRYCAVDDRDDPRTVGATSHRAGAHPRCGAAGHHPSAARGDGKSVILGTVMAYDLLLGLSDSTSHGVRRGWGGASFQVIAAAAMASASMQETTAGIASSAGPATRCLRLDGLDIGEMASGAIAGADRRNRRDRKELTAANWAKVHKYR